MIESRKNKREALISCLEVFESNENKLIGYLVDISNNGMMLYADDPYEIKQSALIRISFPDDVDIGENVELTVKSIRCEKDQDLSLYQIGFEFVNISPENLKTIAKLTDECKFYLSD